MLNVFIFKKSIGIGIIIFIFLMMQMESVAANDWELITEIPTKRKNFTTAVVDNKIYLIGGTIFNNWNGPFGLSIVEVYDPQTNSWQRVADMPTLRTSPQAAVVDSIIYVFGGFNGKDNRGVNLKFPTVVDAYNPQTDTWVRKQDMPVPRFNFGLGVVAGKIYLIGGSPGIAPEEEQRTDRVDIYDPATDTWGKGRKMPTRRDPFSVKVVNDHIYVIGGYGWPQIPNNPGPRLTVIEEYNPITNQWRQKNDMLELKDGFGTAVVRDAIYLIGGAALNKFIATVDVYQPQIQKWSDIPALPMPLVNHSAAVVNGKIYVFSGFKAIGEFNSDVVGFDTSFRAVEANGKMLTRWGELKAEPQKQP